MEGGSWKDIKSRMQSRHVRWNGCLSIFCHIKYYGTVVENCGTCFFVYCKKWKILLTVIFLLTDSHILFLSFVSKICFNKVISETKLFLIAYRIYILHNSLKIKNASQLACYLLHLLFSHFPHRSV